MHKRIVNQMTLKFTLTPQGPLLIKSGREAGADPTILDMNFVRIYHAGLGRETVYLPGSSLKGTIRSYCERVARTVGVDCCNPFDSTFCGKKNEGEASATKRYRQSCTACRLFGNTTLASHFRISDAYPTPDTVEAANRIEQRDGVAIDRISGAVAVGPFSLEVITQGTFEAALAVDNFQLWQVGLLAVALRDLGQGRVPIGFGKSRGLGRVNVTRQELTVSYPGRFALADGDLNFAQRLYGVAAFPFPGKEEYHFRPEEPMPLEGAPFQATEQGDYGRVSLSFQGKEIEELFRRAVPYWRDYTLDPAYRKEG
ncbi:MAG: CRISPR-associated protein [Anaerolineae bacterium]|nr:CRISPR-associated protein [Anaerolineae bacterium]